MREIPPGSAAWPPPRRDIRRQRERRECKSIRSSPTASLFLGGYPHDDLSSIRHLPRPCSFGPQSVIGPPEMRLIVAAACRSVSATRPAANVHLLHPGFHSLPPPSWIGLSNSRTMGHPPSFVWRLMSAHPLVQSPIASSIPAKSP